MTVYRGGVFPYRYEKREKLILVLQRKADIRKIPQRWYWRHLLAEEGEAGGAPYDEYFELPTVHSRWAQPTGAHLYIDDSGETKGAKKGNVDTKGVVNIEMSRAEARRLGELYKTKDDKEFIRDDVEEEGGPWEPQDFIYVPRPGDLFMFKNKIYEIKQITDPQAYGPTQIPVVFKGTAHQFLNDSTQPVETRPSDLFMPETSEPPVVNPSIRYSA